MGLCGSEYFAHQQSQGIVQNISESNWYVKAIEYQQLVLQLNGELLKLSSDLSIVRKQNVKLTTELLNLRTKGVVRDKLK